MVGVGVEAADVRAIDTTVGLALGAAEVSLGVAIAVPVPDGLADGWLWGGPAIIDVAVEAKEGRPLASIRAAPGEVAEQEAIAAAISTSQMLTNTRRRENFRIVFHQTESSSA